MTKIFNIDGLQSKQAEIRKIIINGEEHVMADITVEGFLELASVAKKMDDSEDRTMADVILFLMKSVQIAFPTCSEVSLRGLTIDNLHALVDFAKTGALPGNTEVDDGKKEPVKPVKKGKSKA